MVTGVTAAPILEMRKPRHRVESMSWDYATTKLRLQIRSPSLPVESQMCLSSQLAQKPMPQGQGRPGEASALEPANWPLSLQQELAPHPHSSAHMSELAFCLSKGRKAPSTLPLPFNLDLDLHQGTVQAGAKDTQLQTNSQPKQFA